MNPFTDSTYLIPSWLPRDAAQLVLLKLASLSGLIPSASGCPGAVPTRWVRQYS